MLLISSFLAAMLAPMLVWGADSAEQCIEQYYNHSPGSAMPFCKEAAEQGSAEAQTRLGRFYAFSYSGSQKGDEGIAWLQKAADQGHADAEFSLGVMYDLGRGLAKDDVKARKWYYRAAMQGHTYASFNLGISYLLSTSAPRDGEKAVKWLQQAAKNGYKYAQFNLGLLYLNGGEITQNFPYALKWSQKAAEQGYSQAQHNIGMIYLRGYGVRQDYHEAEKWFRKAANQKYAFAQYALGVLYQYGLGVERDAKIARKWYSMPASQRYDNSIHALAILSKYQAEISKFPKVALDKIEEAPFLVLNKAIQLPVPMLKYKNDCEALTDRKFILDQGIKYKRQIGECRVHMEKTQSARDIFLFATNKYGNNAIGLLSKARTPEQSENLKKRLYWERKSAEMGYFDAQYDLGTICLFIGKGDGFCQSNDPEQWLGKAASQNREVIYCMADRVFPNDKIQQLKWFAKAARASQACGIEKLALYYAAKRQRYFPVAHAWYESFFESMKRMAKSEAINQALLQMLVMKFSNDFQSTSKGMVLDKEQKLFLSIYIDDIQNGKVNEFGLPESFDD